MMMMMYLEIVKFYGHRFFVKRGGAGGHCHNLKLRRLTSDCGVQTSEAYFEPWESLESTANLVWAESINQVAAEVVEGPLPG